jgi:hypothetical protein
LNSVIEPEDRVIGVDVEQIRLYLNAPLYTLADSTRNSTLRGVADMQPDEVLLTSLRRSGFTYILVTRAALHNPPTWFPYLKNEFLGRFAGVEFMDSDTILYRLKS